MSLAKLCIPFYGSIDELIFKAVLIGIKNAFDRMFCRRLNVPVLKD
jgi:hypothetical protein